MTEDEKGLLDAIEKKFPAIHMAPQVAFPWKLTTREIANWIGGAPNLMLEIGCNDGEDTAEFLSDFPVAEVVAFEPDPRAITKFKQRISNPRCTLVEAAVAEQDGETELFMSAGAEGFWDPEWDKSSSICEPTRHLTRSPEILFPEDRREVVRTMRLDTWWAGHGKPVIDFIWCDPQGSQAKIIIGGPEALEYTRWLYIEYYDDPLYDGEPTLHEICEMLPGWQLVATYEFENALLRNEHVRV